MLIIISRKNKGSRRIDMWQEDGSQEMLDMLRGRKEGRKNRKY